MKKETISGTILACAGALLIAPASASTFSYTTFDISIGRLSLDESIVIGDEIHDSLGTAFVSGAYQFDNNLVLGLGLAGVASESGDTEVTGSTISLTVAYPFAVTHRIDIVPQLAYLTAEDYLCAGQLCLKDDEDAIGYGLELRAWAIPDSFEIIGRVRDTTFDDSNTVFSVGGALWWQDRHSARLVYSTESDSDAISLGYRYSW